MIDEKKKIYLLTDLLDCDGIRSYNYNAVYAFRSAASALRCETFIHASGGEHSTTVTPVFVSPEAETVQVITEIGADGSCHSSVFTDYDEARDYVNEIRASGAAVNLHHDSLKIHSRFTSRLLHTGWAEL